MRFDFYHPGLNLLFFAVVIVCALVWNHPVFVAIGYMCAFIYSVKLRGKKAWILNLILILCIAAWAAFYAFWNHFGVTNLGENIIGNKITLESCVYGFIQGVRMATVIMWLSCLFELFTTDKVEYLLGRFSPRIALGFSLIVRAVPVIAERLERINGARAGIGYGKRQGSIVRSIKNALARWSSLISWCIERFVESSASMRSRGSLIKGRTSYALYRFDSRDRTFFLVLMACVAVLAAGSLLDQTSILYSPAIVWGRMTALSLVFYGAYACFCLLPFALQVVGEWNFDRQRRLVANR